MCVCVCVCLCDCGCYVVHDCYATSIQSSKIQLQVVLVVSYICVVASTFETFFLMQFQNINNENVDNENVDI